MSPNPAAYVHSGHRRRQPDISQPEQLPPRFLLRNHYSSREGQCHLWKQMGVRDGDSQGDIGLAVQGLHAGFIQPHDVSDSSP